MDKDTKTRFPFADKVGKSWERDLSRRDETLKAKIDTLLARLGKKPSEVYKKLGIDKADWSRIVWGIVVPDIRTQVKISDELECDSLLLWGNRFTDEEFDYLMSRIGVRDERK